VHTGREDGQGGGEARDAMTAKHPVGRLGRPEEIAAAVLYLCSDTAKFTTGTSLKVDGGWLACKKCTEREI
jgi:NAD(P)-dependent dehydrogenase (short-subunit alcohol dehydrogenase family)